MSIISKVIKRDGRIVDFDPEKIVNAIWKALKATGKDDRRIAESLGGQVVEKINRKFKGLMPHVEEIQDIVEETLVENSLYEVAKAYILYRRKRSEIREIKRLLGVTDDLKLTPNAAEILKARYLLKDEKGRVIETPGQMLMRVARYIGLVDAAYWPEIYEKDGGQPQRKAEARYEDYVSRKASLSIHEFEMLKRLYNRLGKEGKMKLSFRNLIDLIEEKWNELYEETIEVFYQLMVNRYFLPNSPTLMNAGAPLGQLSACFVIPVEDSIESIFDALKATALIHKSGGGTGFDFSRLRAKGDVVRTTSGVASGPVSFMQIFDVATEVIKQGGCISASSFVRTDKGLVPIGALLDCPPLKDNPTNYLVFDGEKMAHAFLASDNGISDVYVIKTDLGLEIGLTCNQRIAVLNGDGDIDWKEAWRLKPNDLLVVVPGGYTCLDDPPGISGKDNPNSNSVIPNKLNENLAELIGLYMANGNVTSSGKIIFRIRRERQDLIEYVKESMLKIFRMKAVEEKTYQKYIKIIYNSECLVDFFKEKGLTEKKSSEASIPQDMLKAPETILCAFLRGLFEGNGIVQRGESVTLQSRSKLLIREAQQALLSLGIISRSNIHDLNGRKPHSSKEYKLSITIPSSLRRFMKKVGFITESKSRQLKKAWIKRENEHENLQFPPKFKLGTLHEQGKYYFTKITEISRRKEYTMDIETTTGRFVANGFLIHNKRRGANMGILSVSHPDIEEFIECKSAERGLTNFNISVAITDEFMKAVEENGKYELINPRNGEVVKKVKARHIMDLIVFNAWKTGDPGLIFIDTINRHNPTPHLGRIESTNPCGEQPLLPYESCNLGSINLSIMLKKNGGGYEIDWKKLREVAHIAVRFLDNVIDANLLPLREIEEATLRTRKIGLGVMGWAEMLFKLRIPYDSEEALKLARKIMEYINYHSKAASSNLAKIRGSFPAYNGSIYGSEIPKMPFEDDENKTLTLDWTKVRETIKKYGIRNATTTTIAPTGTISIIAGTSSGIEPAFALAYVRVVLGGVRLLEVSQALEEALRESGLYKDEVIGQVLRDGNLKNVDKVPEELRRVFTTALDIDAEWHVKMQAAFQEFTDNAVSKTVNLKREASYDDVRRVFLMAYRLKCKGITVYRYGSKGEQVLYVGLSTPTPSAPCPVCEG
ncbi:TPA: adenosylcobalamin-dependent ribonucleoside-diphosphate reductase [Candidatus Bathyarchaeota archaeon]|nr:adenosylcobalamin-dependent ribonucleoside-diphosphate reductase [Candidatus Bathyarchaeota archaeon]